MGAVDRPTSTRPVHRRSGGWCVNWFTKTCELPSAAAGEHAFGRDEHVLDQGGVREHVLVQVQQVIDLLARGLTEVRGVDVLEQRNEQPGQTSVRAVVRRDEHVLL